MSIVFTIIHLTFQSFVIRWLRSFFSYTYPDNGHLSDSEPPSRCIHISSAVRVMSSGCSPFFPMTVLMNDGRIPQSVGRSRKEYVGWPKKRWLGNIGGGNERMEMIKNMAQHRRRCQMKTKADLLLHGGCL